MNFGEMAESFEERLVKAVKEHTHLYDTSMRLHFDKEALETVGAKLLHI